MTHTFAEDTLPPDVVDALLGRRPGTGLGVRGWGASSQRGSARSANEDAFGARGGRVFVLADGMGGRPGGAGAADAAVATLLDDLDTASADVGWDRVVANANRAVIARAVRDGHPRIGAAVVAARVADGRVTILHLGDARAYRLRDGDATQLTSDHNIAAEVERARVDPARIGLASTALSALTVFLGDPGSSDGFGVRSVTMAAGDRLVLCSDGVHAALSPDGWQTAAARTNPEDVAALLVEAAVAAGSTDDATALVIAFGSPPWTS
ncbi:MAG: protein phosphatase 2C domain-containing protein [Ilumatobacteraceae bacterium]